MTPAALLMTLVHPGSELDPGTATSVLAQYGQDGSAYLWMIQPDSVYRYSMGSEAHRSILLSENRLMGASRLVMDMAEPSLDPDQQMWVQIMINKLGQGIIQNDPGASVHKVNGGIIPGLLKRLQLDKWEFPKTSQNSALWAHLTHGGILIYEVSRESGISPIMSQQLQVILRSAGARIINFSVDTSRPITLSFSGLQSPDLAEYLNVSMDQLEQLAK